jgi:putative membrane protein
VTADDARERPIESAAAVAAGATGAAGVADSAPRRTGMAAERTYLAWFRTGLGALGLSLAVGRLIPALIGSGRVPFAALGVGYGLFGAFLIAYAAFGTRSVRAALAADRPLPDDWWAIVVTTVCGLALAAVTVLLVLVVL